MRRGPRGRGHEAPALSSGVQVQGMEGMFVSCRDELQSFPSQINIAIIVSSGPGQREQETSSSQDGGRGRTSLFMDMEWA